MSKQCAIILAAGEGKRFHSKKSKVLQEVLGKPMADWVYDHVKAAGIDEICMVTGHLREQVEEHFAGKAAFALQAERRGTAHAVMQAKDFLLAHKDGNVLVLNGDAPFISPETITGALAALERDNAAACVVSARLENPFGYGRILRDGERVLGIVEEKDASPAEKKLAEVSSGVYWFRVQSLLDCFGSFTAHNSQGEYYLPQAVELLLARQLSVTAYPAADSFEILGANDRAQQLELCQAANERHIAALLRQGVSFESTQGVLIGPDVAIGCDTVILPGTILKGQVSIGEGCVVGPNSVVQDSVIGDRCKINATEIHESRVGSGVTIGPFSQLRPRSNIADNVKIGNFVEVKNSNVGEKTSIAHLTYVGDSDIGQDVNFGCGCVTVNYDGKSKFRTTVGDHVFIGCNTNLVAPVTVESESYIAAGSTITHTVPSKALAIARARQVVKEGWVNGRDLKRK